MELSFISPSVVHPEAAVTYSTANALKGAFKKRDKKALGSKGENKVKCEKVGRQTAKRCERNDPITLAELRLSLTLSY